jgi:hypothetical protein
LALVLGPPIPGYVAPAEGPTTDAAIRAMAALKSVAYDAGRAGVLRQPWLSEVGSAVCADLAADDAVGGPELAPAVIQSLMHAWSALHGFVSLEAFGHLTMHSEAAREALFVGLVRTIAGFVGLPAPLAGWPTDPAPEVAGPLGWHGPPAEPGWHG